METRPPIHPEAKEILDSFPIPELSEDREATVDGIEMLNVLLRGFYKSQLPEEESRWGLEQPREFIWSKHFKVIQDYIQELNQTEHRLRLIVGDQPLAVLRITPQPKGPDKTEEVKLPAHSEFLVTGTELRYSGDNFMPTGRTYYSRDQLHLRSREYSLPLLQAARTVHEGGRLELE